MASIPFSCRLTTPSSNLKQPLKIVSNPTSSLFNRISFTRTNKPAHLHGFRVSAKAKVDVQVATLPQKEQKTDEKETPVDETEKTTEEDIEDAKKTRFEQWGKALKTLISQIKSIRQKINTHFLKSEPVVAKKLLEILDDVENVVDAHDRHKGLKKPIETTNAMMKLAKHFEAYRKSEKYANGVIPIVAAWPKSKEEDNNGVISVDKSWPRKTLFSPMIDMFTEVANLLYGQRGDHVYLQGNFAPVDKETPPTEIQEIEGKQLPSCINGMLIRNGPNPQFEPLAKYLWLDGDGMLHATYFKDGKVSYASRYVKTSRFKQEQITGQAEFPKYGDYTGAFGVFTAFTQLLKSIFVLDMSYGFGTANENIVYHCGVLLALEDFDRPYAIKITDGGDLETLGVYDFDNKLSHNCAPHIKKDPKTGEMFVIGAAYTKPYMTYRVVTKDGSISEPVTIDEVSGPTYMHDFCITDKYVIIMDLPFTFDPEAMLKNDDWIYNFDHSKASRFGIRSRDPTKNDIKWFEFKEPFFIFHNANAWEDGDDKVVLYGCKFVATKSKDDKVPVFKSVLLTKALVGDKLDIQLPELYKFTFNLKTGEATQEQVAQTKLTIDYPKINENKMARKSRYVYASEFVIITEVKDGKPVCSVKNTAIIKYDLEAGPQNRVTRAEFGGKIYGSEVVFVPSDNATAEDDGYLLTYVHDEEKGKSYLYVICAKEMVVIKDNKKEMNKVAVFELPNRVPYGFHATFINKDDLAKRRTL